RRVSSGTGGLCVSLLGPLVGPAFGCPLFFFFQAEDGIRDWSVTGVQTCALPISPGAGGSYTWGGWLIPPRSRLEPPTSSGWRRQIGRASCRERVEIWGGAVSLKKKCRDKGRCRGQRGRG